MFTYLRSGATALHGVAAGKMAEVVHDLGRLPDADIQALAVYFADLNGSSTLQTGSAEALAKALATSALGSRLEPDAGAPVLGSLRVMPLQQRNDAPQRAATGACPQQCAHRGHPRHVHPYRDGWNRSGRRHPQRAHAGFLVGAERWRHREDCRLSAPNTHRAARLGAAGSEGGGNPQGKCWLC